MKPITKILLTTSALALTATSFAMQPASFGPGMQGFYLGADAGFGATTCSACSITPTASASTTNTHFASTIFGGYQLNQYLALEAGWGFLPDVNYEYSFSRSGSSGSGNSTASTSHFYGAVKGILPLNDNWNLFGKIGYDLMSVKSVNVAGDNISSLSPTGLLLAAGGSYNFSKNLALALSYNQLIDSASQNGATQNVNVSYGTFGLTYLF
jgi:OOP family OmpA-OmpF porin